MPRDRQGLATGGWYHVTSQAVAGLQVFQSPKDREDFREGLRQGEWSGRVRIQALVLSPDAYQLVLQLRGRAGPRALRCLHSPFVRRFSDRHGWTGPVFRTPPRWCSLEDPRLRDTTLTALRRLQRADAAKAREPAERWDLTEGASLPWETLRDPAALRLTIDADEQRLHRPAPDAPFEFVRERLRYAELTREAPGEPDVGAFDDWMVRRMYEGHCNRRLAPMAAVSAARAVVHRHRRVKGKWIVYAPDYFDLWRAVEAGLLRLVCGLRLEEVAELLNLKKREAHDRVSEHERHFVDHCEYAHAFRRLTLQARAESEVSLAFRAPRDVEPWWFHLGLPARLA